MRVQPSIHIPLRLILIDRLMQFHFSSEEKVFCEGILTTFTNDTGMVCTVASRGGLDKGSPMSHVDFKKWQCRMSLSLTLLNVACQI